MVEADNLYWGEIHTHTELSDGVGSAADNFDMARRHLDFWSMTDHAYDKEVFSHDYRKTKPGGKMLNEHWDEIKMVQSKDPALSFLLLFEKARRERG